MDPRFQRRLGKDPEKVVLLYGKGRKADRMDQAWKA